MKFLIMTTALFSQLFFCPSFSMASNNFGIIVDAFGETSIIRDNIPLNVQFGQEIMVGDILNVNKGGKLVIVGYKKCDELNISSSTKAVIKTDTDIITETGKILPTRSLPACYQPESFNTNISSKIGGTVLRGGPESVNVQEVENIRQSAESGKASNSELVGLIAYDLNKGMKDRARKYYYQLLNQNPKMQLPSVLMNQLK